MAKKKKVKLPEGTRFRTRTSSEKKKVSGTKLVRSEAVKPRQIIKKRGYEAPKPVAEKAPKKSENKTEK